MECLDRFGFHQPAGGGVDSEHPIDPLVGGETERQLDAVGKAVADPVLIHQAIHVCGAHRIGHGCRLREDGDLLHYVNDHRIALECCPSSNVQTGAVRDLRSHPLKLYHDLGLRVTINTDNRLMSDVTLSDEFVALVEAFDISFDEMRWLTTNAMKSSFLAFDERLRLINGVIKPGYERLQAELQAQSPRLV